MSIKSPKNLLLPLMLASLMLLVLFLTMLSQKGMGPEPFANRSIFNSDPSGYRAWFLASRKAGLPVSLWQKSFSNLDTLPIPSTMLVVEPYTVSSRDVTFGPKDIKALLAWVAKGNTLILLDDFKRRGSESLLTYLGPELKIHAGKRPPSTVIPTRSQAMVRSYLTSPLRTATPRWLTYQLENGPENGLAHGLEQGLERGGNATIAQVLLEDGAARPLMIRVPYLSGSIILGTPVDLGSNQYLHGPANDNFQFLSNLLVIEGKPVFINEFVHGYKDIDNLFAYFQQHTPLGRIFMQLVFAFLFLLWLSFVRWTPRSVEPLLSEDSIALQKRQSGSMQAFMASLGGIYYRTRSAGRALEPLLSRIGATLRKRYRMTLEEEGRVRHLLEELSGGYSSKDESPTALWESLQKALETVRRQERIPHRDLLKLSRQLSTIQERLAHGYGTPRHAGRESGQQPAEQSGKQPGEQFPDRIR